MRLWSSWERRKDDLHEELEAHLRIAVEERVARGESPEEARVAVLREMGNTPLVADVTRSAWGWQWTERIVQDVRYALRQLAKSPGYTATALITLTLAIGANTAVFGLMYALLLKSLPVERPDRIVQIGLQVGAPSKSNEPSDMVSGKLYDIIAEQKTTPLSGLCAWRNWPLNLHDASGTRPLQTTQVTGGCFKMLGVHAAMGRLIDEADDKRGGGPEGYAAVLGYNYWRDRMGGDPNAIGRVLDFGDRKAVVVGVMEPGFESVEVGEQPLMYLPSQIDDPEDRDNMGSFNRILLGRLKDGATAEQVLAQIDPAASAAIKALNFLFFTIDADGKSTQTKDFHITVAPGRTGISYVRSEFTKPLYLIEAMVGLSLLVACAYLATLAGTRALARRRELAVRVALGASRMRLAAQLCWESALLAGMGTALGLLFAWGAGKGLIGMLAQPGESKLAIDTAPTGMVLLFALGVTGLTVILAGVIPAWRASRVDPVREIKEGELALTGRRPRRIGSWLAPVQVGLSLVIVVIAALMATTLVRLLATNPGFRTSGVTFTRADFSDRLKRAGKDKTMDALTPLYDTLLERIRHTPGVENVSVAQAYQLSGAMYMSGASSKLPSGEMREVKMMIQLSVTPGYFATLGIPLLEGRDFAGQDKQVGAHPVCILSRSAAEYFFPGQNAVGQRIDLGVGSLGDRSSTEVVGVAGDTLYNGFRDTARPMMYVPYLGGGIWNPFAEFAVQSENTSAGEAAVREAFKEIAPDVPLYETRTMRQLVGKAVGRERMMALLAGFFAVLTLVLSAIGMYGLLNYSVIRRRREIGVRMALGASRVGVVRLVLKEALWMVVPGLVLGGVGAWAAARFVRSLLFGVKPLDPWVLAASAAVLLTTAVIASLLPARRAAGVHPMDALRSE